MYATGLNEKDMSKAQVGISSVRSTPSPTPLLLTGLRQVWYSGNPCNMHLMDLNHKVRQAVEKAGLVGMQFNTIGVRYGSDA